MTSTPSPSGDKHGIDGSILAKNALSGPPRLEDIESAIEEEPPASRSKIVSWASWDWG